MTAAALQLAGSFGRSTAAPLTNEQLRVLHSVAVAVQGVPHVDELLPAAAAAASTTLRHAVLALGLLDRRHGVLEVHSMDPEVERIPLHESGLEWLLRVERACIVDSPRTPLAPDCRSVAVAPLWVEGRRPGLLVVGSPEPGWYGEDDLPFIEGIAGHIAVAFDRARMLAREARRTRQLRLVSEVAEAVVSTLESELLLQRVVERIDAQLERGSTTVWLHDPERRQLSLAAVAGDAPLEIGLKVSGERGVLGRVLEDRAPILIRDTRRDPDYAGAPPFLGLSELCVPVLCRGQVRALINLEADRPDAFDEEGLTALQAVAGMLGAALENSVLYKEVRSFNDTLREQLAEATQELEDAYREIAAQKALVEAENRSLKRRLRTEQEGLDIVGTSAALRGALQMAERVGASEVACLIQGESGTGKELFARLLHRVSPRADQACVTVNCAAIPEDLLESTLFGHEKGAFTGAVRSQRGLVETANGGTLFLDEIGDLPMALQAKLLRFLQSGEYYRVGGTDLRNSDVRVVSATNLDLKLAVDEGRFRGDLFFRISTLVIVVPPLRMRPEDIPLLVRHFLDQTERGRTLRPDGELLQALEQYPWPGNVRELENVVARLVVLAEGSVLGKSLLTRQVLDEASLPPVSERSVREPSIILSLEDMEKAAVARALSRHRGDKKAAAADLGIALRTLYNKIQRYDIDVPPRG